MKHFWPPSQRDEITMIEILKQTRRKLLRLFKMRPIHKIIRLLKKNDFLIMENTLEVFGYKGEYHTLDYVGHVKELDIWEIAEDCEQPLKKNLPLANVKITNSYEEIKTTNKTFDTIIIDNHQGIFGDDKCEHFEIIDDCFKKLNNKAVLIANIIPNILISKYNTTKETRQRHIEKRILFYKHQTGTDIDLQFFERFYRRTSINHGFNVDNLFFVKRNYLMTYVVLCLEKKV